MKRYMNTALLYAVFAMAGGVFYREFTKFNGFTGKTTLSVVHTHYFLLGMVFFLLLLLLEKKLFLHWCKDRSGIGCLSYRAEPDCGDVCRAGPDTGTGACAFPGQWMRRSPAWPESDISCWGSAWCFCWCRSGAA